MKWALSNDEKTWFKRNCGDFKEWLIWVLDNVLWEMKLNGLVLVLEMEEQKLLMLKKSGCAIAVFMSALLSLGFSSRVSSTSGELSLHRWIGI